MSYLYRTADFSSSNDSKCVLSFWVKKTVNDIAQGLFLGWNTSSNYATCYVNTDDTIYYKEKQGGTQYETRITSGARKFRDTNAWYHFVFQWDYTQATASNRIKVWINGELQTWENTGNLPPQNNSLRLKSSDFRIGDYTHAGSSYFNWKGLMSHVHFIDDAPYDTYQASTFGETDSTTGEWKIKTNPGIATNNYGSQGFFVLKDGNSGTDQSGKGNNLSTSGTITKTEDCPSNVFCTWNRLNKGSYIDMNYGNTNIYGNTSSNNGNTWGTISFPPSGKYYWETKVIAYNSGSSGYPQIGIIRDNTIAQGSMNGGNDGYVSSSKDCYYAAGGTTIYSKNGNVTVSATSLNDIIMCAMDSTAGNMKFWMGVNGTWWNSGDPANGTNAIWTETGDYQSVPFISGFNGSRGDTNFGNGYFGTTAVSSAGTNASGNGIFEYDVPTGYTALSTKGLNL